MKKWILGAALVAALMVSAEARNFAVPAGNPAVTIVVPDSWKVEKIDYGYSAQSPDENVMFFVEYAKNKKIDAMIKLNKEWMAENEINGNVKPEEREMDFNGTSGSVLRYDTTDANGKTLVDFVLLEGGGGHVIMLTIWGSEAERAANKADIAAIMNSVRPIR